MVAQATVEAGETWYVAIAPGETKVLTLEQLDDWFRLELIDADTKLWQPGMPEWLPLSVVAGIEEPPTRPGSPPAPRRAPSPPSPVASAPAPARVANPPSPAPARASNIPAPVAAPAWPPTAAAPAPASALPRPAALSGPPPPPSSRQAPPASPTGAVVNGPWPATLSNSRSQAPVDSFRPHVMSGRPAPRPRSGGAAGRVVIALSVVLGLGLTLYRNDLLRDAAASAGMSSNYQKLESALGGPGFGTPRSVEALIMPASLSDAVRAAQQPVAAQRPSSSASSSLSDSSASAPKHDSSNDSGSTTSPRERPSSGSERRAPSSAAPRSKSDSEPSKGLGIKGSANKFDPLNGKL